MCSSGLFLSFDFRKPTLEKMRSSSTEPMIWMIAISATFKNSPKFHVRLLLLSSTYHTFVKGLTWYGGTMASREFDFIHILNKACWEMSASQSMSGGMSIFLAPSLKIFPRPQALIRVWRCLSNICSVLLLHQYCRYKMPNAFVTWCCGNLSSSSSTSIFATLANTHSS